ncbi:MAG: DEAD/DEAH box helicase [Pseudomonadota bacterium]
MTDIDETTGTASVNANDVTDGDITTPETSAADTPPAETAEPPEPEATAPEKTFAQLGLSDKLLKALEESGYTHPTPIQAAAIPEALTRRDVLGIAQTGTGKTASFTLPMIERLSKGRARARMPRSLVLAPTRELAAQVADNFEKYGQYHKLSMALLIGGVSFGDQDAKLTRGVDVLIATPGRMLDHFERGKLLLNGIEVMVVDEADRMLDMGFIPDIERIFKLTPMTRQTLFFSATMPPEIQRITDTFLHNPVRIEVSRPAQTASTITQQIIRIPGKDERIKRMILRKLLDGDDVKNGIIFCNRKSTVDIVAKSLQKYDYSARPIHGDLPQSFRTETLDMFRNDTVRFLVASDVAARGLDIKAVSHVFNFDVPIHADDYVHRIGRTGRAGLTGTALMLVGPKDAKAYDAILSTIGKTAIQEKDMAADIAEAEAQNADRNGRRQAKSDGGRGHGRGGARDGDAERGNRRRRGRRSDHDGAPEAPANRRAKPDRDEPREDNRGDKERRPRRPRREDEVVGLGDHVPAFLQR